MTRKYYQKFPYAKTIYYRFEPTLTVPIQYKDDVLLIQGEESFIPGIINKTLRSFEWVQHNFSNYDYIVRSNISTIIDFEILDSLLNTQPVKYGGGVEHKDDNKSWIQGTAIILSKDTVNSILKNKESIDQTLLDDVALGHLIHNKIPEALPPIIFESKFVLVPDVQGNENELKKLVKTRYAFYRNRCQQFTDKKDKEDRNVDVSNLQTLLKYLNQL
jgi:hypothetical protein